MTSQLKPRFLAFCLISSILPGLEALNLERLVLTVC